MMPAATTIPPAPLSRVATPVALAVRAAATATLLMLAVLVARNSGLLLPGRSVPLIDRWAYNAVGIVPAALVLARALMVRRERRAWLLLALGMACFTAGDLYTTLARQPPDSGSGPNVNDLLYMLFFPFALAMIVRLVEPRARRVAAHVWLDAGICALTLAAAGAAIALDPVIRSTEHAPAALTTGLTYQLGAIALVVFVLGIFAAAGWRPGRVWLLAALGFATMAAADSIYLFQVAEGTYRPGGLLDLVWPAALALLAWAAWARPRSTNRHRSNGMATMLVPCVFGSIALFLLVRGNYVHLNPISEALAGAALLVVGVRFALTFNDVRRLSEIRERQARTDYLTGLANRRHFYAQLDEAVESCRRRGAGFALLTIDLDHFKELNDTLGHYAGDLLLAQIGPRMRSVVRADDVARLGGDEFGLIIRDASAAASVAERIRHALGQPFELEDVRVSVQASVGIALFPQDAERPEELLQRADIAMFRAKQEHRRHAFYAPGTDHCSRERLGLVSDLKAAIAQGGLIVHYQPQVDLRTNTVSGVEALVRWQHPRHGLLGADRFVDLAEQTGVIRELTASVLDQALAQQRAWLDDGRELSLAVNVSATNLLDAAFLDELRERLERWRTPPGMLCLEITESVLIAEGDRVHGVIDALGDLGVNLSLDDFGTGYSPLSYLRELPVTEIKIDRSFVEAMMSDRDTATIVSSVIALARRLGIDVVAEGIETPAQLELLRSFECPFAQGYLFSKPLPSQVATRWLREDALEHIAAEVLAAGRDGAIEPAQHTQPAADGNARAAARLHRPHTGGGSPRPALRPPAPLAGE